METFGQCIRHSFRSLYPSSKDIKNPNMVYLVNTLHLIGVFCIQFGIFLHPKYLKYYIIYLMTVLTTYFFFNNRCFMSIVSNYYSGRYINMLCIKISQAKLLLVVYLLMGVIFYIEPSIAPYMIIGKLIKNLRG